MNRVPLKLPSFIRGGEMNYYAKLALVQAKAEDAIVFWYFMNILIEIGPNDDEFDFQKYIEEKLKERNSEQSRLNQEKDKAISTVKEIKDFCELIETRYYNLRKSLKIVGEHEPSEKLPLNVAHETELLNYFLANEFLEFGKLDRQRFFEIAAVLIETGIIEVIPGE